ncbi:ribonuclease Z [Pseudomonas sp. BP8]|nr:ribonuclease Z [Pseudomonas sp. BP8]
MDLQFLGTSSGVPTKARNVSATAVIEASGKRWYLVDCGEGTQHQLLHTPLSMRDLRAVFITHVHGDHCYGLPGLLASAGMSGRTEPLELIMPVALHEWIRQSLAVSQTFLPFELRLLALETLECWSSDQLEVSTRELSHRVPSYAFVFTEINPEPRLASPSCRPMAFLVGRCGASWPMGERCSTLVAGSTRRRICNPRGQRGGSSFVATTTHRSYLPR